jgi:hypothetical protein
MIRTGSTMISSDRPHRLVGRRRFRIRATTGKGSRRMVTPLPEGEGLRLGERSDPQAERVRGYGANR